MCTLKAAHQENWESSCLIIPLEVQYPGIRKTATLWQVAPCLFLKGNYGLLFAMHGIHCNSSPSHTLSLGLRLGNQVGLW